jgi:urease accessory protein
VKRLVLPAALLAMSGEAFAHGSIQGIDHFSGGLLHPLVEPAHLIVLVALGLLVGQRGIARSEVALFAFAVGVMGGLLGAALGWSVDLEVALLVAASLSAGLVATALALPGIVYAGIAGLLGAGIGIGSNPEGFTGGALLAALAGVGLGANLWLLSIAAIVSSLKRPWLRILVRVVGSWACASSVLVLALWLSGRHAAAPGLVPPSAAIVRLDTLR